ncbi:MAG: hypothetical protein V3R25_01785 [Nitrosomonadaceae bacterium]
MTTKIDFKNKNGKHFDQTLALCFPSISVGSAIPRRVAPQQSPLPFHRTYEINGYNRKKKVLLVEINLHKPKQNVEDICPDGK